VTGARTYFSLAVIRSLGRAGHEVTAADSSPRSIGFFSRYTKHRIVYPSVGRYPNAFIGEIRKHLLQRPHDVTVPLFEEALLLSEQRHQLTGLTRLPLPEHEFMIGFHDTALSGSIFLSTPTAYRASSTRIPDFRPERSWPNAPDSTWQRWRFPRRNPMPSGL
jgi:hypothetical protein